MNAPMVHMTAPALLPVSTLLAHTTAHANKKDTVIMQHVHWYVAHVSQLTAIN